MKVCPHCGTTTKDDTQVYCLMDGTPLVDSSVNEPTAVMSPTEPTVTAQQVRKSRTGLWVFLGLFGVLVIGTLIGLLMYAAYRMGSESATVKVNTSGGSTPTPKPTTPKPTPQPSPSVASSQQPSPESSPEATTSSSDEPTPISWSTNAGFVREENGLTYTFQCPPGGTPGTVWGSDPYTADSSICTAAVHAGKITLEDGGVVTIEFTAGRQTYGATTRNGITTYNYGQYPHSIVFK